MPRPIIAVLVLSVLIGVMAAPAAAQTITYATDFTYQGYIEDGGSPVSGTCDFTFALFNAITDGAPVGTTQSATGVTVTDGIFSAVLDFGPGAFNGEDRWLEIRMACNGGTSELLTPRQLITPAPYSAYAGSAPWAGLIGIPADIADGDADTNTTYGAGSGLTLTGTTFSVTPDAFWSTAGNAAGTFLGTTTTTALDFRVNNERALRLEPNAESPNIIGGNSGNSVTGGAVGATISGGGYAANVNLVTDNYGTVGGGTYNQAGDNDAATDDAPSATVSGGHLNTASGGYSAVGGGLNNAANGTSAAIGGGNANVTSADFATVGGGTGNQAQSVYTTVGGGKTNTASGSASTISGGEDNGTASSYSTIGGGVNNRVEAAYGTIGGGGDLAIVESGNLVSDEWGTVSGGRDNQTGNDNASPNDAQYATVGGGRANTASGGSATVGGGSTNQALGPSTTVSGGLDNQANGDAATVGGGYSNAASASYATISGGQFNTASGTNSTVPGGAGNSAAGDYSFASGRNALINAVHDSSFVWSGVTSPSDFTSSTAVGSFVARAPGGVSLYSMSSGVTGCTLAAGDGTWSCTSDRAAKDSFAAVDPRAVLDAVAAMPITTWEYIGGDTRHIGPVAQDFYAAFGVGSGETTISTVDADGVALAAIQGLNLELEARNIQLEAQAAHIALLTVALITLTALSLAGFFVMYRALAQVRRDVRG